MRYSRLRNITTMLLLVLGSACTPSHQAMVKPADFTQSQWIRHTTVPGQFEEVKSFLELAITDRGIKINNVSHIAEMLKRTGAEVGDETSLYSHGQAIEFCSATISRAMMKSNAHYISLCPYIIFIYELPQQPGTIHLSYRNLLVIDANDPTLQAVDQLLQDIVSELKQ
ncbi:MAG: DUF302 domain-containing protein [Gammaproteobacteria bacterium]|nr:DUF302 domain-containing protein [Gammaproteobacteria bacterium]MDH5800305.1 DUF302 domain-containing protein [Gammaproteobacteria bacterium]